VGKADIGPAQRTVANVGKADIGVQGPGGSKLCLHARRDDLCKLLIPAKKDGAGTCP